MLNTCWGLLIYSLYIFFNVSTVDRTPPTVINCPNVAFVNVELGETEGVVTWIEPISTDVSGTDTLVSSSSTPGMLFPLGDTTVIYLYSDESGNTATCQFCVTVGTGTQCIHCNRGRFNIQTHTYSEMSDVKN